MKERSLILCASIIAVTCALSMFYVMQQIRQTSEALQRDGIDIFNFTMQNDHNTDQLAYALLEFQRVRRAGAAVAGTPVVSSTGQPTLAVSQQAYIDRFDILYSTFRHISYSYLPRRGSEPRAQALLDAGRQFVAQHEALMRPEVEPTDRQIDGMVDDLIKLSRQVNVFGHWHYQYTSQLRDRIRHRLDELNRAFWFFGSLLLVSGVVLTLLLRRATRRMEQLNIRAERHKARLNKALDELTSGDNERRAQNRFIAAASHDLRQPLHALGLYLSALRSHVVSSDGQAILDNTHRSTEALTQLLNSLLDISRLDAGVIDVCEMDFPLNELLQPLYQTFLPDAMERGLDLNVPHSRLWVHTDRTLLDRILRNLVNNALHYTHQGSVSIEAVVEEDEVVVRVTDTGLGIPAIEQEAIFNEGYQLHNPERDRTKGLGLGLSIVRRLTHLLGLELRMDSIEGQGTRFEVVLRQAWPVIRSRGRDCSATVPVRREDPENVHGLAIMVIDDEQDVREGMQMLLESEGCEVVTADSAETAVRTLIRLDFVPDMIVADYRLRDDQTGSEAIARVREETNEDIPAMIITGDTSPTRLKEAAASGLQLLHKPVATDELFAAIRTLANR